MKKVQKNPFRMSKGAPGKGFVTTIIKIKKEHIMIIPDEIVKAFEIEIGDIAVFESSDKCVKIKFVKKTMFSFVEKADIKKLIKNKKIKASFLSGKLENDGIVFGKKNC